MGPTFLLPATNTPVGRQQVSSWHLSSHLEETPVPNPTVARATSAPEAPRVPRAGLFSLSDTKSKAVLKIAKLFWLLPHRVAVAV